MKTKITLIAFALASINCFAQWQSTSGPSGAGVISSLAIKDTNIFAGTETGGVFLSTDKGVKWTSKNNGLTNLDDIIAIAVNDTDVFAGAYNSMSGPSVFLTNDNAANWSAKGLPYIFLLSIAVKPSFLIAGTWFGVSVSTNNGTSWMGYTSGLPSNAAVSALAFDGSKIFCGVSGSSVGGTGVFRSSTNGKSWTSFNTGLINTFIKKLAVIGSNVFAGTYGGVFISNTTTPGWSAVNTGLSNTLIRSLWVVGNNLFAGTDNGIFLTTDNGSNWTNVSIGLPSNSKVYSITSDGINVYIGADTTVWQRPLVEMGITGIEETFSQNTSVKIYPNPFNSSTTIQFNSSIKNAELNIYNMYGQKIKIINHISGDKIKIDRDNLPSGIYFIHLTQDNTTFATDKLIITE